MSTGIPKTLGINTTMTIEQVLDQNRDAIIKAGGCRIEVTPGTDGVSDIDDVKNAVRSKYPSASIKSYLDPQEEKHFIEFSLPDND